MLAKTKDLKKYLLSLSAFVATFLVLSVVVFAQSETPANDPASGLQISPTRTELSVKDGNKGVISLTVTNVTGGKIILRPEVNDFMSDNETGTPVLVTDPNFKSAYSIKDFIPAIGDITLNTKESRKLTIPISVPSGQAPGSYFGVVRFKAYPVKKNEDQSQQQVSLTASAAHIVLLQVPGKVNEQLQGVSIKAENDGKTGSLFTSAPKSAALELKNTGNSFIKPFGKVTITDFKNKQVYTYEINNTDPKGNVLPDSTRIFHNEIKNINSTFGKYKITASVAYGNGGNVLVLQSTFWVIALWIRILIAVVILLLVISVVVIIRKMRGNNRRYRR